MIAPLSSLGAFAPSALSFQGTGNAAPAPAGARASFAAALGDLATNATGALRQAEQVSVSALKGEADTRAVVDAVMGAEQTFQAAVAIRDKIVTAYLEVSRMQI